jgi:hypothetical protein
LEQLESEAPSEKASPELLSEHLSLLARWYYRPAHRRVGEIFFREETTCVDSAQERPFPLSRILRGISRVFCGQKDTTEVAADAGAS